jgi:hypothetical protein
MYDRAAIGTDPAAAPVFEQEIKRENHYRQKN